MFLLFTVISLAFAGKVLIYAPVGSKSLKITYMPIVEELAKRGHAITIVTGYKSKHKIENVQELIVNSRFQEYSDRLSNNALKDGGTTSTPVFELINAMIEANDAALSLPEIQKLLKYPSTKFDIVVSTAYFNDVGVYLAHRFKAQLVIFSSVQTAIPWMDDAIGQQYNTAVIPFFFVWLDSFQNVLHSTNNKYCCNIFISSNST